MKRLWKWFGWGVVAFLVVFGWQWVQENLCLMPRPHVAIASTTRLIENKDCAAVLQGTPGIQLAPRSLTIQVQDRTSHPSEENINKLLRAVCLSMYGARQAAAAEDEDTYWFTGLPFLLQDDLDGLTDQARFVRGMPWDEFSRSVEVGVGMSSTYLPNELLWTMGHELGHGVYGHAMLDKWIVPLSLGFILLGAVLWGMQGAGPRRRNFGRLVVALGVGSIVAGTAVASMHQELAADVFGVRAAAQTGMGLAHAKEAALQILARHPAPPESWWTCRGINRDVHPATKTRVETVQALQ